MHRDRALLRAHTLEQEHRGHAQETQKRDAVDQCAIKIEEESLVVSH